MANVATLTAKMAFDLTNFLAGARTVGKELNGLKAGVGSVANAMVTGAAGGIAYAAAMTAVHTSLNAIKAAANGAYNALAFGAELAADQEQAQVAFSTMLHSGQAATKMLKELEQFAIVTPFDFPGVRNSAKTLLAMGVSVRNVLPSLQTLGDIASGVGVPLEQLSLVFGQVKAAGRLMTQDMNQFTSAGIALPRALAKELKISETSVRAYVESGRVSFRVFQNALVRLAETDFAGGMEKQSKTALGALSNIRDMSGGIMKDIAKAFGEKMDTTGWMNDFAGFLAYVRQTWVPVLIEAFGKIGAIFIQVLEGMRASFAQALRFSQTVSQLMVANMGSKNADPISKALGINDAVDNIYGPMGMMAGAAAHMLETNSFKDIAANMRKGMQDLAPKVTPPDGLTKQKDFFEQLNRKLIVPLGQSRSFLRAFTTPFGDAGGKLREVLGDSIKFRPLPKVPDKVGALTVGSSEAFSAIIAAMTGKDKRDTAEKSLEELKAISKSASATVTAIEKALGRAATSIVASFSG